jgi:hypothetical protein
MLGLGALFFFNDEDPFGQAPATIEKRFVEEIRSARALNKVDPRFFATKNILFKDYRQNKELQLNIQKLAGAFAHQSLDSSFQIQIDLFDAQDAENLTKNQILFQLSLIEFSTGNKVSEYSLQF